jgi:hypothetical protein
VLILTVTLTNPLLLLLLLASDVVRLPSLERGDEGGMGPLGAVNLVLYMTFRIFAYSSNILKANFDLKPGDGSTGGAVLSEAISGEFDSQAVSNMLWVYATMGRKPGERVMVQRGLRGRYQGVQLSDSCKHSFEEVEERRRHIRGVISQKVANTL